MCLSRASCRRPLSAINDVTVTEGNSGTVAAVFTVTVAPIATTPVSVAYATANGTATAADYVSTSGTLTIPAGSNSGTITVPVVGDTAVEPNETFTVTLSSPTNATLGQATGTGTIVNDDILGISIANTSVTEGDASAVTASFTVSLSSAVSQAVTVNYATADVTAAAGVDYTAKSGTLTFAAGTTSQTIPVTVLGDTRDEADETFTVTLSAASTGVISTPQAVGTIVDNDATPSLAINNVTVTEPDSGTVNAVFTVALSAASGRTVTVNYTTVPGTATTPADFTTTSGALSFPAGTTSRTITVPVAGDLLDEGNDTFTVGLSGAINATIAAGGGVGTITDNDPTPTIAITNVSATEGNSGTVNAVLTVSLSAASGRAVTVNYATGDGTATVAGTDYTAGAGTLTFAAGTTTQSVTVVVRGDALNEGNETLNVNLSGATNATIADSQGVVTIVDDDPLPSMTINNVSIAEGNSGTKTFTFTVTLSAASGRTVSANYATANGTASSTILIGDYHEHERDSVVHRGHDDATISVTVRGDTTRESNETFFVNLTSPSNVTIADAQGIGTILNDD